MIENEVATRSGTTADWASIYAPILGVGEIGIDVDTDTIKIGDGVTAFPALSGSKVGGDGVGALFFGNGLQGTTPLDNTRWYVPLVAEDSPPRMPQRDDLAIVSQGDPTAIEVVASGLYDIVLQTAATVAVTTVTSPGRVRITPNIEINGTNSEPPAWDLTLTGGWDISVTGQPPNITLNVTLPQVLVAGDLIRISLRAQVDSGGPIVGTINWVASPILILTPRG